MLVSRETVLTYTNDRGLSMSLAPLTNFFLLTCKETLTNDIQSQKLRALDGEHFDGSTLGTRHIEITGYFKAIGNRREMERTLTRTFNINTSGELTHRRTGTDRSFAIGCRLEQLPDVEFDGSQINFTIKFLKKHINVTMGTNGNARKIDRCETQITAPSGCLTVGIVDILHHACTASHVSNLGIRVTGNIKFSVERCIHE